MEDSHPKSWTAHAVQVENRQVLDCRRTCKGLPAGKDLATPSRSQPKAEETVGNDFNAERACRLWSKDHSVMDSTSNGDSSGAQRCWSPLHDSRNRGALPSYLDSLEERRLREAGICASSPKCRSRGQRISSARATEDVLLFFGAISCE
jgi:hypothetical protein